MTALEQAVKRWGLPRVDMFGLKSWRLWWQGTHWHRFATSGELTGHGASIEDCAQRALDEAGSPTVFTGARDECQQCKDSVDW